MSSEQTALGEIKQEYRFLNVSSQWSECHVFPKSFSWICWSGVIDEVSVIDSLLIPPDHPSRKRGDNYYLNRWAKLLVTHNASEMIKAVQNNKNNWISHWWAGRRCFALTPPPTRGSWWGPDWTPSYWPETFTGGMRSTQVTTPSSTRWRGSDSSPTTR